MIYIVIYCLWRARLGLGLIFEIMIGTVRIGGISSSGLKPRSRTMRTAEMVMVMVMGMGIRKFKKKGRNTSR